MILSVPKDFTSASARKIFSAALISATFSESSDLAAVNFPAAGLAAGVLPLAGGSGFNFGGGQQQARVKGSDLVYELPLTLREVATGTSKTVTLQHQGGSENLTVKIPAGLITGKKLRLAGKGNPSPYGGPPGDLYIKSQMLNDPLFSAENTDLYLDRELKLSEAILGTTIAVPTIDDKKLSLKIPPGTKHGTKMRLSGHGLPFMKGNKNGDLFVRIQISVPKKLTKEQKKLVKDLAAAGL